MKRLIGFLKGTTKIFDKEYALYTGIFLGMMLLLYAYMLFKIGADVPQFTYAEF